MTRHFDYFRDMPIVEELSNEELVALYHKIIKGIDALPDSSEEEMDDFDESVSLGNALNDLELEFKDRGLRIPEVG